MSDDGLPSMCEPRLSERGLEFILYPPTKRHDLVPRPIRACKGPNGRHSYWRNDKPVDRAKVPEHALGFFVLAFRQSGVGEIVIERDRVVVLQPQISDRTLKRIRVPLRAATDRLYETAAQLAAV